MAEGSGVPFEQWLRSEVEVCTPGNVNALMQTRDVVDSADDWQEQGRDATLDRAEVLSTSFQTDFTVIVT